MGVLNFIVKEIFGQGAIFLAMIAMIGLIIQKKNVGEIIRGTFMTAIGFFVLNRGVGIVSEAEFDDDPRLVKIALDHQPLTMHEKLICLKDRRNGKAIHAFFAVVRELGDPNR